MTGWDTEVDVAVVGGGACGVMTALRAARNTGLVVAVFEKSTREGCNAAISSGSLAAGGTRFQAAAGIDDSPKRHADDILRASGDEEWRPVVEALCAAAPELVEWIAETGYPIEIGLDMPRAGMTALRLHTDTGRLGGGRLMRHLRAPLDAHGNAAFVDEESKGYSSMAGVLRRQPGERAAMIWDAAAMAATRESEMMHECLAAGAVQNRPTIEDLAASLGRTAGETGRALTPLPGRRQLTAPYHFAWVTHGLLATQGGLVIDPSGRVLDGAGEPIPRLRAGGGTACGLAGPHSDGYLSGNGLLSAFGMGWIIGNGLAAAPVPS